MFRSRNAALGLATASVATLAVALPGGGVSAPSADAASPTSATFRCTSGKVGWKYCKTLPFAIQKCRNIGVRALDTGSDRWIKVQLRRGGAEDNARFTTGELKPGDATNGRIAGRDRFRPQVFVDAEGLFARVSMTIRLRASGCR